MSVSDPHPTDEQLSAAIDGLDDAAQAHAEGCGRCSYRLGAMQGVAEVLGVSAPVVDEVLRERQLAAAVLAGESVLGDDIGVGGGFGGAGAGDGLGRGGGGPRRGWRAAGPTLGAVAAALLVVLAVPLLLFRGGGDSDKSVASGDAALESTDGANSQDMSALEDLGEFADGQALRSALIPRVGEEQFSAPSGGDSAATAGGAGSQDEASSPTTTTAPAPGAGPLAPASAQRGSTKRVSGAGLACVSQANRDYGERVEGLVFAGNLTWQGTPSVVLVYQVKEATGPIDKLVVVLARSDCTLLTSLGL